MKKTWLRIPLKIIDINIEKTRVKRKIKRLYNFREIMLYINIRIDGRMIIIMGKHYTIANTTMEERKKIVNSALGISTLDAKEPTFQTKKLVDKYIYGKMEISEILEKTIKRYKVEVN